MVDALKSVLDFFGTILDFVEYLVTGLVQLIAMIPSAFAMLTYFARCLCLIFCFPALIFFLTFSRRLIIF